MLVRILTNYGNGWRRSSIREGIFDLLLSEILVTQHEGTSKLYIVSPWLRNFDLHTPGRGNLQLIMSYLPSKISFFRLLEEYLKKGGNLVLVCLPPHQLVNQDQLNTLTQLHEIRNQTESMEMITTILAQIEKATKDVMMNRTMLEFLSKLKRRFGDKVRLVFNERLHAKICCGKFVAIIGSANLTSWGLSSSDEICLILEDPETISGIRKTCESIESRYFSKKSTDYEFSRFVTKPTKLAELHPDIERLLKLVKNHLSSKEITEKEVEFRFNPFTP
jgi:hypothetical protein